MNEHVFDPGLQPERTLLAWRRTCLSFGLASLVVMRYTVGVTGAAAVVLGLAGTCAAIAAYVATTAGYRRANRSLHHSGRLDHGGLAMFLTAIAALALGAACLNYLALTRPHV